MEKVWKFQHILPFGTSWLWRSWYAIQSESIEGVDDISGLSIIGKVAGRPVSFPFCNSDQNNNIMHCCSHIYYICKYMYTYIRYTYFYAPLFELSSSRIFHWIFHWIFPWWSSSGNGKRTPESFAPSDLTMKLVNMIMINKSESDLNNRPNMFILS